MDGMNSLWSYQEGIDEMRQKLLCTTLEFEQFKSEASEELRKQNENVKQLLQLLEIAVKEKDEAKYQLQKLVNIVMSSTNPSDIFSTLSQIQSTKPNSSITESNSYNLHGSSPVNSFLDAVSSPAFSNNNVTDSSNNAFVNHQSLLQDYNNVKLSGSIVPRVVDHASVIIDNLVKGKTLPQKGKLLQAVVNTPPLLESLLVIGPLPKWRNPPRLQPFQMMPFFDQRK